MAANQALQEDQSNNGGVEVVKKVNINFGSLRLNDSKKRYRPPGVGPVPNCQMTDMSCVGHSLPNSSIEGSHMSDVTQNGNFGAQEDGGQSSAT